ncbi:MAG: T9SS type A sorting domain-containing protein, partial [Bacteroidales bacterium]|nr:T9SS type A sorting domain-containing protein [Bacteroidales bacterium]
ISWLWDFGDGTNSTERNPVKTYDEVGVYTVSLTISNGTNTITKVKENYIHASSSGLLTPSANQLVVYPNPARDKLTIKGFETGTIEIYDLTGKLLHHTQIQDGTIDISTLEQGIFLIMLKTKDQTFTTRLLKE